MERTGEAKAWFWPVAWTVTFLANLIVPLGLGWGMCGDVGRVGLVLAVVIYWGIGMVACRSETRWREALVSGGILVGLSQLLPFAQLLAGMAAFSAWGKIPGNEPGPLQGAGGFVVTTLTGGILIVAALVLGWGLVATFGPSFRAKKPTFNPGDEF